MNDIFEHYNESIRSVIMSRIPQERLEQYCKGIKNKYQNSYKYKEEMEKPALQYFASSSQKAYCVLCDTSSLFI